MPTKPRQRKLRTPRSKRPPLSAYKTVAYEIKSMVDAFNDYTRLTRANPNYQTSLKNATAEAFLLHVRNLRDFFIGTSNKDDILAIDFVSPSPRFRLPMLRSARHHLDKRLAHPSYKRAYGRSDFAFGMLREELLDAWCLFLNKLEVANPRAGEVFARELPSVGKNAGAA
jgi:hypothetical protein